MGKRILLNEALLEWAKGIESILVATTEADNKEEHEAIMKVFNWGTKESYASERYTELFEHSFEDEAYNISQFVQHVAGNTNQNNMNTNDNIKNMLVGLNQSVDALIKIDGLVNDDEKLKKELQSIKATDDTSFLRNPFEDKTPHQYMKGFKGWRRAFKKELGDEIGRAAIKKYEESIEAEGAVLK